MNKEVIFPVYMFYRLRKYHTAGISNNMVNKFLNFINITIIKRLKQVLVLNKHSAKTFYINT